MRIGTSRRRVLQAGLGAAVAAWSDWSLISDLPAAEAGGGPVKLRPDIAPVVRMIESARDITEDPGDLVEPEAPAIDRPILFNTPAADRINLNTHSVDEAAKKALGQYAGQAGVASSDGNGHGIAPAWHHFNRHFSYGIYRAGGTNPVKANNEAG